MKDKDKKEDRNYGERFKKGFRILTESRNSYEVFDDLMFLYAIEIQNATTRDNPLFREVWEKREKEFIRIANKYDKNERTKIIPQMFALMVLELEKNPDQDFLGKMFMELEIANKNAGQFFTPYDICKMMASVTFNRKEIARQVKENGFISVYEPSCGAGANLIAVINKLKNDIFKKLNYQNHVWFAAQDIDARTARMCYIQLSLLGVAGVVKVGNTLTDPEFRCNKETMEQFYFTPVWFTNVWLCRRLFHGYDICMNKKKLEGDENSKDK